MRPTPRQPAPRRSAEPETTDRLTPERLADATQALAGPAWTPATKVALAVSGGGDSLALLWLAARAFPGRAHVLSVDHGLRPEAAAECAMVAQLAQGVSVPHATLVLEEPPGPTNVQARARDARYTAMAGWCAEHDVPFLLTAHHADDQAETLLMRLARGSGIGGLAAIRPAVDIAGIRVLRPLLGWTRAELTAALAGSGWSPAEDPSNSDPHYDRTAIRELLAREPLLDAHRLSAATAHLRKAEDALAWATDRAWASRATQDDAAIMIDPEALPPELQRRLLVRALDAIGAVSPDGPAVARLLSRLRAGGSGTLGPTKATALPDGRWRVSEAPPRKSPQK